MCNFILLSDKNKKFGKYIIGFASVIIKLKTALKVAIKVKVYFFHFKTIITIKTTEIFYKTILLWTCKFLFVKNIQPIQWFSTFNFWSWLTYFWKCTNVHCIHIIGSVIYYSFNALQTFKNKIKFNTKN